MEISNPDLINSCRVCRSPNQDGDYECLYEALDTVNDMLPELSHAGKLYEELLGEISPEAYEYYPRYLCNSCDLQMRLFKKLKDKALKTMEYLSHIPVSKEEQQLHVNEEEFLDEAPLMNEFSENQTQGPSESGYQLQDVENVLDLPPNFDDSSHTGQELYGDIKLNLNNPQYIQETSEPTSQYDHLQFNSIERDIALPTQNEEVVEEEATLQHYPLNAVIPENGDIVIPDTELSSVMDKSDYVLEIYELLEDGSKTAHSEMLVEGEEPAKIDDFNDSEIEVGTKSQYGFYEEQFVDDVYGIEGSEDEFQIPKPRKAIKRKLQNDDKKREYKCTVCSEVFTNSKEFKHHREHIHTQVYSCHICSKTFKSQYSLPAHMKIHDENPAFQCEICQRTFTQKTHYQYHMNRHNNIRNFKCEECGKAFIAKTDLKIHMRQHTGDRPYVCDICGKDYMLAEHLKSHALKHTDQQFQCDLCHQNFATPKTLRQHKQTIHVDEPKFKCQFCSKPFRRKHHLQYHMKQLHPSTHILTESLYDIIDEPEDMGNFNCDDEDGDITVDDDLVEKDEFIDDPGYVALSDDTILM